MKKKLYIRVADGKQSYRVAASFKPSAEPLYISEYKNQGSVRRYLPTVHFAIDVTIPESAFTEAGQTVADINLQRGKTLGIAAEVAELESETE